MFSPVIKINFPYKFLRETYFCLYVCKPYEISIILSRCYSPTKIYNKAIIAGCQYSQIDIFKRKEKEKNGVLKYRRWKGLTNSKEATCTCNENG